jgi:selenoprotein W-related protein
MHVRLTYCSPCGHLPRALDLTQQALSELGQRVASWTLVPGAGGVFDVEVDGELVFSKQAVGRHATLDEVLESLRSRAGGAPEPG